MHIKDGDRLLNLVHNIEVPPATKAAVIGVDDFALRKGRTYGTIIVNQETRRPVEVLSDRSAETLVLGSAKDGSKRILK